MGESDDPFRDFGLLPDDLPPPADAVRSCLSPARVAFQYVGTALAAAVGLGVVVLFVVLTPLPVAVLGGAAAAAGVGAIVYVAVRNDYRWVELDGDTLRARHLYTGRTVERSVADIECLITLVHMVKTTAIALADRVSGRVKGVEIVFQDHLTPLRVRRADPAMTRAKALVEAVLSRMARHREVAADVINLDGRPLVKSVHWAGERPDDTPPSRRKANLVVWMIFPLIFGPLLAFMGAAGQEKREVGAVPPREIALAALVREGPGENRHVTLTGFRPGGYAVESKRGSWTHVWVALFPADGPGDEIRVVLSTKAVGDEVELARLLQPGRVTGVCSRTPRSSWGSTLGPELVRANRDCPLSAAWEVEEMREPPSEAHVTAILAGAAACLLAVIALAAAIVRVRD